MKPNQQTILAESLVPNSVAYRKTNLEAAHEALIKAKSISRTIRRAKSNESEFSRGLASKKQNIPKPVESRLDGLISAKTAEELLGLSNFTIQNYRKKGLLPFKKENSKYYYNLEDLKKLEVRPIKRKIVD